MPRVPGRGAFNSLLRDQSLNNFSSDVSIWTPFNSLLRDQILASYHKKRSVFHFQFSLARSAKGEEQMEFAYLQLSILSCEIS